MLVGETPMTGFHTWHFMCEGIGQNSGYGHEESYLMHDMKFPYRIAFFCMECGLMYVCHFMCI